MPESFYRERTERLLQKKKNTLNEFKKIHSILYLHGTLTPKKLSIT